MKNFEKWQGCGNDFVIIDSRLDGKIDSAEKISKICDRHFGIGADGVIYVLNSDSAEVRMRIFNADGSEAEMCGNGIRCFTKFLLDGTDKNNLTVETGAGILKVNLRGELVSVDMGEPILEAEKIPVKNFGNNSVVNQSMEVDGKIFKITCVSMGNPHCIIFVDDVSKINLAEIGSKIECHEIFPKHTNVEFVQVIGENKLRMRVWERGSGITLACGTGACAVAVAANLNKLAEKSSEVILDGGTLQIDWRTDNHVLMTGAAKKVFVGNFDD
ncbi:MAG: diaminopimelate epimerase [Selenomonadaceae bacterium]|nr:diaminopimelate epimerase [Selenomonadaceae bacterium]